MRTTHNRRYDHHDTDLDTNIVLDGAVGDTVSGATIHAALLEALERIAYLENLNGIHRGSLVLEATVFAPMTGSFFLSAEIA